MTKGSKKDAKPSLKSERYFVASVVDPRSGLTSEVKSFGHLVIGRDPGDGGLILAGHDETVSARALSIEILSTGLLVGNTSSFSEVEINDLNHTRILFPGDQVVLGGPFRIAVEGQTHRFLIHVAPSVEFMLLSNPTNTRPLVDDDIVPSARREVLTCLCAPIFYPERFERLHQRSSEISHLLKAHGHNVSHKEVDNKIQRTKERIFERVGISLTSREDLADFLVRKQLITQRDVDRLLRTK